MIVLIIAIQQFFFLMSIKQMKTNTNTENKKAFQKWLSQCPTNAIVIYQKQFRDEPKKYKAIIEFD